MQVFWQKSFKKVAFLGSIWLKSTKMGDFRGLNAKMWVLMEWMCFVRVWRLWCMYCEWVMKIFGMWVGRRTESDRTADGIQSDGGRNPIGRRTEHDDRSWGFGLYRWGYGGIYIMLWGYIYHTMELYILCYGFIYTIMCRGNRRGKGLDFVSKNLHTMRVLCRKRKYFALKMQFFAHFYW